MLYFLSYTDKIKENEDVNGFLFLQCIKKTRFFVTRILKYLCSDKEVRFPAQYVASLDQ